MSITSRPELGIMRSCISVLFIIYVTVTHAQHKLSGIITSIGDGTPVIGATMIIEGTNFATVSNVNGHFSFDHMLTGHYTMKINSVGFASRAIQFDIDNDLKLDISLTEKIYDLPDIVVESITMTGGLSGVGKSLGSAHFIGQKEIQKFSYTDINRTLRNIPGANIQEEDGYGLRPNIGLRATGSERSSKITIMEDGILAAPAPYAAPAAYYFPSIGRMEALEILKGSSQIKYGPYTTGGAINLLSTPLPTDFSGHADLIAGSDNYGMLHANLGNAHKNISYLVETLQYSTDGFKELDGGGNTGFTKQDYIGKFRVHTNPDAPIYQSLTFKFGQAEESGHETYLGLTDEDFREAPLRRYTGSQKDKIKTRQNQYSITHFTQLTPFLDIHTSLYRTEFKRNWYKLDKVNGQKISNILSAPLEYQEELSIIKGENTQDGEMLVKANNRSYFGQGIQTNLIFHLSKGKISHKLDIGLRMHKDQVDRFQWEDIYLMNDGTMKLTKSGQPGTESNRISTARAIASYAQYKITYKKLTITTGLRSEHINITRKDYGRSDSERLGLDLSERENKVNVWIPGLATSYQVSKTMNLFGGIHKGFAPPGSKEGTKPEESWNYELGWRHNTPSFNAQILGYVNNYSNLLGADLASSGGNGTQDLFNGGHAIAQGIEASMTFDIASNNLNNKYRMPVSLAYTYTTASFQSDFDSEFEGWGSVSYGDHLPYVPQHQIAVSFSIEHKKVLIDISTKYNTAMLTQAGKFGGPADLSTDDAFTTDFAVNYKLSKMITAFANINNLTNNIYIVSRRPAGVRPNQPRTINLGLKANF